MNPDDHWVEQQAHSVVLGPGAGRQISFGDAGVVSLKTGGAQSGGRLAAYEFALPAATAGPPLHLHRTWDEAFYVLEGAMTFLIDGIEHRAPAGSFVFVPRGILHTFWNAGATTARQLTVFTPAGIEDYFDALSQALAHDQDPAALMAEHDMVVPPDTRPAYGSLTDADRSTD